MGCCRGEKARKHTGQTCGGRSAPPRPVWPRVWVVGNAGRGGGERGVYGFRWGYAPPSRPYHTIYTHNSHKLMFEIGV